MKDWPQFIYQTFLKYFTEVNKVRFLYENPEQIFRHGVNTSQKLIQIMEMHGVPGSKLPEFAAFYTSQYHEFVKLQEWAHLLPQEMRQLRVINAICTSNSSRNVARLLGQHRRHFDVVHCMHDHEDLPKKPLPESYLAMAEIHKIDPGKSVYSADEKDDAVGALNAGFAKVILGSWGASVPEHLEEARDLGITTVKNYRELMISLKTFFTLRKIYH